MAGGGRGRRDGSDLRRPLKLRARGWNTPPTAGRTDGRTAR